MTKPASGQLDLFAAPRTGRDEYDEPRIPLNASVPDHERDRLGPQHEQILARLREGPATNHELQQIAHRFGARLEEIKRAGIPWTKQCVKPGVYEYRLV